VIRLFIYNMTVLQTFYTLMCFTGFAFCSDVFWPRSVLNIQVQAKKAANVYTSCLL